MTGAVHAAPGDLDNSFSENGYRLFNFPANGYDYGYDVILSDGKIIVGGLTQADGVNRFGLARFTGSGELDESFSNDGSVADSFGPAHDANYILLKQGDNYVTAGWSDKDENRRVLIARYNSDGDLTEGFGRGGLGFRFTSLGPGQAVPYGGDLSGNKIVLAGQDEEGPHEDGFVIRYTGSGDLDQTFSEDGIRRFTYGQFAGFDAVAVQDDDKIVAAGYSTKDGLQALTVARFKTNGEMDDSFSSDGITRIPFGDSSGASAVAITPGGKIVVGGYALLGEGEIKAAVARLHPGGGLDDSFAGDGKTLFHFGSEPESRPQDIVLQSDGKALLLGSVLTAGQTDSDVGVARLRGNGTLDDSFSGNGRDTLEFEAWDNGSGGALQANGRFMFVGGSGDDYLIGAIQTGV